MVSNPRGVTGAGDRTRLMDPINPPQDGPSRTTDEQRGDHDTAAAERRRLLRDPP